MLYNHLKLAYRQILQQKSYALIHITGLGIGLASCLVILLYVKQEMSYDRFFPAADQIYKMVEERSSPTKRTVSATIPYAFTRIMEEQYPEVAMATAISGPYDNQNVSVQQERKHFLENAVFLADSNFLQVFPFKLLDGDRKEALKKPHSIVLTETTASRYFGDLNPLGQVMMVAGRKTTVTGVCEDPPSHSHFKFNYLISSSSVAWFSRSDFSLKSAHCYFKLQPSANAAKLEAKLPDLIKTYVAGEIEKVRNTSWEAYQAAGHGHTYLLKPLKDIHLNPANIGRMKAGGNLNTLRILVGIALLIFGMACINFINLSIAQSARKAKEIGVRKVMGAFKWQLIIQFLSETFLLSTLGLALAWILTSLALPYFNAFLESQLQLPFTVSNVSLFLATSLFISLLAGIYPALVLSAYSPLSVFNRTTSTGPKGKWARNSLVVLQFSISFILILSTLVIYRQVTFMEKKSLGYDKSQIMIVEGVFDRDPSRSRSFIAALNEITTVEKVAGSLSTMGNNSGLRADEYKAANLTDILSLNRMVVGDRFAEVLDMEMVKGQFFIPATYDSLAVVLNESAVELLGITDPIGKRLTRVVKEKEGLTEIHFTIRGVIKDFHFQTLRQEIKPLVLQSTEFYQGRSSFVLAKLAAGDSRETISLIEEKWENLMGGRPFKYRFLDETLAASYEKERRLGFILSLYAGLSILIALIGLFALSAYTLGLRRKEIGIRKIIGANLSSLLILLSKEFTQLVGIAFVLAAPLSWYLMGLWLQNYAFSISMPLSLFILSGIGVIVATYLTISFQTIKLAQRPPVEALRDQE